MTCGMAMQGRRSRQQQQPSHQSQGDPRRKAGLYTLPGPMSCEQSGSGGTHSSVVGTAAAQKMSRPKRGVC
eukprot:359540-Chlamydomonas_euryale.AAC.2